MEAVLSLIAFLQEDTLTFEPQPQHQLTVLLANVNHFTEDTSRTAVVNMSKYDA